MQVQNNRAGLILSEKDTQWYNSIEETGFGNSFDTCLIGYNLAVKKVHIGRSATVSVFNVIATFSGKSTTEQQPVDYIEQVTIDGKMELQQQYCKFFFEKNTRARPRPSWLLVNGDTLRLEPVKQAITPNGKIKKGNWGVQLRKDSVTYAAFSISYPGKIYLSRHLTKDDRLLVASYISLIAYYF
jgi:hypothetical protein